jgi:hypothetical protein
MSFELQAMSQYIHLQRLITPRSSQLVAASYLRKSHITQPATNTPPRNIAKQYRP